MLGTGTAAVIAGGDYHATSATQYHDLGTAMVMNDGRIFRYVQSDGTGFAAGLAILAATPTTITTHNNVAVAAASIGQKFVDITLGAAAATENFYAGGYLWINDGTGEGHMYTISGHPASAGSAALRVFLHEPLAIALVASGTTEASLILNPYKGVKLATTASATRLVGVSCVAVAASAFGWVQTKGLCSVKEGGTDPLAGDMVIPLDTGVCGIATSTMADLHILGVVHFVQTNSGDQTLIWINLE